MQTACLPNKHQIVKCTHGISSYYFPMGDRGIKFFANRSERDYSKLNQHLAFLAGLAPEDFEIVDSDGFYGYYTESVEMLHDKYTEKEIRKKFRSKVRILCDELYSYCDFTVDTNPLNFGIKGGKVVLVDFGYHSYTNYSYMVR